MTDINRLDAERHELLSTKIATVMFDKASLFTGFVFCFGTDLTITLCYRLQCNGHLFAQKTVLDSHTLELQKQERERMHREEIRRKRAQYIRVNSHVGYVEL